VKANVQPKAFADCLLKDASVEERVKVLMNSGISLNSLFYTFYSSCLSTDEIFMAFEYHECMREYEVKNRS
jgi:hypothetical protein